MTLLDKIEHLHNQASDTSFVWFPFVWMRPKPSEPLRRAKLVRMSMLFGLYYGAFFALKAALQGAPDPLERLPQAIGVATAVFFAWFNLVTATFWNRRAARIAGDPGPSATDRSP